MPTYEYSCTNCGHEEEVLQKITEEPLKKCPACSLPTYRRGPGGGLGLHFKGNGFYITDYPKKTPSQEKKEPTSSPKT